jgi:hypothetical protein
LHGARPGWLRKGGFSKTNAETPASKESDLRSEIFDQAQDGMPKEGFENWLDTDNNTVVATITVSEICQAVADDKSKLAEVNLIVQVEKKKFKKLLQPMPRCEKIYEFFVVVCNIEQQTSEGIMSMSSSFSNY